MQTALRSDRSRSAAVNEATAFTAARSEQTGDVLIILAFNLTMKYLEGTDVRLIRGKGNVPRFSTSKNLGSTAMN
jgi:hypothetical protein